MREQQITVKRERKTTQKQKAKRWEKNQDVTLKRVQLFTYDTQ
jgi:hypothetical protein